ncbi:hypothetical protein ACFO5K_10565 [Nocardia halotolerans]|uniref:Uncharacterized protein n=1 Tax=Nocardia halotolerans TaxID=1755878 RepID=A0ABV8VEV4_9NOCA
MSTPAGGDDPARDVVPRTDRGLTEAGDAGHRAYVQAKLAEAATEISKIRAPQNWQRQVEAFGDQKILHDMLAYGYQHLQGRTEAAGWRHEHERQTMLGLRRHDAALISDRGGQKVVRTTVEFKAGSVSQKDGLKQLYKERLLLKGGRTKDRSEYVIRAARPPHPEVMKEAKQLEKDFPGRFVVVELNERDFERAVAAGRPIVEAKTVERLGHLIEKIRSAPELRVAPRALERFAEEIVQAKERGAPIGLEVLVGSRLELANLVEVDKQVTRERDKIAREGAQLRLRESQIVERVQAQQREDRQRALLDRLATVDREIVVAAVSTARDMVPVKIPGRQPDPPGLDPTAAAIHRSMTESARVIVRKEVEVRQRDALARLALPSEVHRAVAEVVLARQLDHPDKAVTVERVVEAESAVRAREEREQQQAREVEAREARERENREWMARLTAAHNKQLERLALEQGKARGVDRMEDLHRERASQELAQALRLDPDRLVEKGIDAQVVEALAHSPVRRDESGRALVVEVGDRTCYVDRDSREAVLASQIRSVERGRDLGETHVDQMIARTRVAPAGAALSREELERKQEAVQRQRELERERTPEQGKSRSRESPGRGIGRGLDRGR